MRILDSIDRVADRYDALFCDIWGVVHNGRRAYPGACAALQRMRAAGKRVILISNVPRPRSVIPDQLAKVGAPGDAWDAIVTSGDATRAALSARAPGPVFRIGIEDYDAPLYEGLPLEAAPLESARFISITGLFRWEDTPADYAGILRAALARDLEMVCANPDIIVQAGERMLWCAGAVARDYEKMGGRVVMAGKPFAPIYELAYRELDALGGAPDRARILCIGDGVGTDVAGANGQGLDSVFIASGMHGGALWTNGAADAAKIEAALAQENARATYAMAALA